MDETELKQTRRVLKRRILTMEWDKKRNQLHAAKNVKLEDLRKELGEIEDQLAGKPKQEGDKSE